MDIPEKMTSSDNPYDYYVGKDGNDNYGDPCPTIEEAIAAFHVEHDLPPDYVLGVINATDHGDSIEYIGRKVWELGKDRLDRDLLNSDGEYEEIIHDEVDE